LILAIGLTACTTLERAPVNYLELSTVVIDLPGTKGATLGDQRNIDKSVAKSCATGILGASQCDVHTRASAERRAELK
jgi:hypothetical protein